MVSTISLNIGCGAEDKNIVAQNDKIILETEKIENEEVSSQNDKTILETEENRNKEVSPQNNKTILETKHSNADMSFISGDGLIYYNPHLGVITGYYGKITSVIIPDTIDGVKIIAIANKAFLSCNSLTDISIPYGVTSINTSAFIGCDSLTDISIPNSVTSIEGAFIGCTSLSNITLPDSVTSIGAGIFSDCASLKAINVGSGNPSYTSENGILFNKDKTSILAYPKGLQNIEYTIPNSVTSIGKHAFAYCGNLTNVIIPNSVTSIGDSAFLSCRDLTAITIPESVISIGDSAFNGCNSLTNITIPDGVASIGKLTFNSCNRLSNITIPDSVTFISEDAFSNCSKSNLTIKCGANSYAKFYAIENNIPSVNN